MRSGSSTQGSAPVRPGAPPQWPVLLHKAVSASDLSLAVVKYGRIIIPRGQVGWWPSPPAPARARASVEWVV